jgi:CRP-like cAMP-binding protein
MSYTGSGPEPSFRFHDELAAGRTKLGAIFRNSPPCAVEAGDLLTSAAGVDQGIYHLRAGWACQFHGLSTSRRVIVDVYLPGDVIGLDSVLLARPPGEILTLTSVTIEAIPAEIALTEMFADRPTALYLAWLLGRRQRRADRFLAAVSGLDARGRLAMIVLDFYMRLRRRKLITGLIYNLPLSQIQIGNYIGSTVVHVNRVLRALRDERVVNVEKHCVTILDLAQLIHLARNGGTVNSSRVFVSASSESWPSAVRLDQRPN